MDQDQNKAIRILLIEDNEVDQFAFQRYAEKNELNYEVTVAASMEETFLLLKTNKQFDVAIVDYMLKDGSSSELVPHLVNKMQVIFVTGQEKLEIALSLMKMGVYEYLVKDFEKSYLKVLPKIIDSAFKHKIANEKLKKAERQVSRLSLALANMDKAVIIAKKDGTIEWVNSAFTKLTGFGSSEVIGTRGELLVDSGITSLHPTSNHYKRVFEDLESVTYEANNLKKDGSSFHAITTMSPVLNENGELDEVVVIETDITEQKKIEAELREAKLKAERSDKAKEQFLANMSHELRTPLNAVLGMAQMLEHTNLDKDQSEYLNIIHVSAHNLITLINDILDFSKINVGELSLKERDFDLHGMIERVYKSFDLRIDKKKVNFTLELDENLPGHIKGDPVRLEQILANLLSNAIKFTRKGHIVLSIQNSRRGKKEIEFRVTDSGIGIPADKMNRIFDMFQQEDMSHTRKFEGVGIGLTIVKSLSEMMDGQVEISSKPGEGTAVSFYFPTEASNKSSIEEAVKQENAGSNLSFDEDFSNVSVLLVEDNKMNQLLAQKFLSKLGVNVTIANDGKEALQFFKDQSYDLIMMDLQMPVMDGFEATKIIRESFPEEKKNIPILAMTAHAIKGVEEKCSEIGLTDFISKPIMLDHLKEKMVASLHNNA